jgi:hypothetical protein
MQTVKGKVARDKQLRKALMDGMEYNPCPVGRDFDSLKGVRLERLNRICKKMLN